MREKYIRVTFRISEIEEENISALMKWSGWDRSKTIRFCLNFTHLMTSVMPAAMLDAILTEQTKELLDDEEP